MRYIALVYQAGIANVFELTCRHDLENPEARTGPAKRLLLHAFQPCIWFVRGMAGWPEEFLVRTFACNRAGDIKEAPWTAGLDDCPFRDNAVVVESRPAID